MTHQRKSFKAIVATAFIDYSHFKIDVDLRSVFCTANLYSHSALIRNLKKLKGTAKLTAQGEREFLKDSKYILFEILPNRTWKGRTSSCRPSKPKLEISLARLPHASTALPCPMC